MPAFAHTTVAILRARNLIAKGKGGNNDVFVTIQLAKEKYQTSIIKGARHPEWFEECELPIPHLHSEIEVTVYHRGVLADDFLGYTTIPLWEHKIHQHQPNTQWLKLRNKPGRDVDTKCRGEIEVKVTLHCHSRVDHTTLTGLKKRSSSLRNLASAVGDKLKLVRSKSFRENRRDPEGSKSGDRTHSHGSLHAIPEQRNGGKPSGRRGTPSPLSTVSFPALDLKSAWTGDITQEGLPRSQSMSGSYSGTMALDRGHIVTFTGDSGDLRTQSLLDMAVNGHSMLDLPSSQAPPPYHPRPSSHDDITLLRPHSRRAPVTFTTTTPHYHYQDPVLLRERARYESIRERTEPESTSTSSSSDSQSRRRPPSHMSFRSLRSRPTSQDLDCAQDSSCMAQDAAQIQRLPKEGDSQAEPQRSELITNGSLQMNRSRVFSGPRHKSASSGELTTLNGEVRIRKRTKKDRLRTYRHGGGRFTVADLELRGGGLYDESLSEANSDSPKAQMAEDLFSVYRNLSKEELLRVVIQNKAQLMRKDQYIRDLESYMDSLLVRVMETQPRILQRPPHLSQPR